MKRYRIISELGKGATGVVYKAVRAEDSSTVALKKLVLPGHLDAHQEEDFIKRFKSEAKAALELKHVGIVAALDCGLDEGTLYIAYELVEGVTLEQAIKSGRKFSAEEVADILIQTSEALEVAHSSGVVHRDISPGNIFLTNDGKTKISDFGVAGFTSRTTVTPGDQSIVGTPGYMAPEQITGAEADPRSDIFSLGCVAYELLTHTPAFTGDNLAQIIHRVMSEQPRPIREIDPLIPLPLEELVFRMLAKNPDYRYQTMGDVQTAATRVLEEIPRARKSTAKDEVGHAPMLVAIEGQYEGTQFKLQSTVTTIGRTIGDILLANDPKVATQHAWITKEETGWVLYDADTDSGTLLNGEEIDREEILAGDRIRLGDTVLEFRGAGGHAGAFAEPGDTEGGAKSQPQKVAIPKRIPWLLIVFLSIPGLIVIAGLIAIGFVYPRQYMAQLDVATVTRWDSAFDLIDKTSIGDPAWMSDAADIVDSWQNSPLGTVTIPNDESDESTNELPVGMTAFLAPSWILSHNRINNEVMFRFDLFNMAEDFLYAVTGAVPGTSNEPGSVPSINPVLQTVRELESRLQTMEIPSGLDPTWEGRKNQLLAVIRRWLGGSPVGPGTTGPRGFTSERNTSEQRLLDGWYTYQEASERFDMLDMAFRDFQAAIDTITVVLDAQPGDEAASAVRGLSFFLQARLLQQVGGNERIERAMNILAFAEADIGVVGRGAWIDAIPEELHDDFRSPTSVMSQIRALRASLLSTPGYSGS